MIDSAERTHSATAVVSPLDVLIVDDEKAVRDFMTRVLVASGRHCRSAESLEDVRRIAHLNTAKLLILDLSLGSSDAVDILDFLANEEFPGCVLLITGYDQAALEPVYKLGLALGLNMSQSLSKPLRPADLRRAIANLPIPVPN